DHRPGRARARPRHLRADTDAGASRSRAGGSRGCHRLAAASRRGAGNEPCTQQRGAGCVARPEDGGRGVSGPFELRRLPDAEGTVHPPYAFPNYRSSRLRSPSRPLVILPEALADSTGPAFGAGTVGEAESDLTAGHADEPLGERIVVSGRVLDGS